MTRTNKLILGLAAPAAILAIMLGAANHPAPAASAPAPATPATSSALATCAVQLNPAACISSTHGAR
jgi:hypothetical protein